MLNFIKFKYMKLCKFITLIILYHFNLFSQQPAIYNTGDYISYLQNKNIGLVVNHTSVLNNVHLVDSLLRLGFQVKTIFSPEHGFFGKEDAGKFLSDGYYNDTISIVSLYGDNKKPQAKDLDKIDVLLFDIQDVGVRFYTYISTLHYVMEACADHNIKLIVLDRPNSHVNYIDGPVLEKDFSSFVGMHPVPIIYGMTIGEYAMMINGEEWTSKRCDLIVVSMHNYLRNSEYIFTIKPSPNLPNNQAIKLYPSLCLFEGTNVSVGRGTNFPFQHFGAPYFQNTYSFKPISNFGSKHPKYENITCYGEDLRFYKSDKYEINLNWLINAYNICPNKVDFFNSFFDKLAGTDDLRKQIVSGLSIEEIKQSWRHNLLDFQDIRQKYLIY